jgi:hypothetical protein
VSTGPRPQKKRGGAGVVKEKERGAVGDHKGKRIQIRHETKIRIHSMFGFFFLLPLMGKGGGRRKKQKNKKDEEKFCVVYYTHTHI